MFIPEIADYETRRELLRVRNVDAVERLDRVREFVDFLPLTTPAVLLAAQLWAGARQAGRPTSHPQALDADALITAQAQLLDPMDYGLSATVIATVDVGDMIALSAVGPFLHVRAVQWGEIAASSL